MEFIVPFHKLGLVATTWRQEQVPGHTGLILKVRIAHTKFQKAPFMLNRMLWEGRSSEHIIHCASLKWLSGARWRFSCHPHRSASGMGLIIHCRAILWGVLIEGPINTWSFYLIIRMFSPGYWAFYLVWETMGSSVIQWSCGLCTISSQQLAFNWRSLAVGCPVWEHASRSHWTVLLTPQPSQVTSQQMITQC